MGANRGASEVRADLVLVHALMDENQVLSRELARVQQRSTRWHAERAAEQERLAAQLMRLRADSIIKTTLIAAQAADLAALRRDKPEFLVRSPTMRFA